MDFNRLRYFVAVASTGSIRGAADILHISPAALSKAIKLLELELKVRLVTPSGRGILVTEKGRALARSGAAILEQMGLIEQELVSESRRDPDIRIGSFEVFTTYFLGELIEGFLGEAGVQCQELIPGELERALERRDVDIGITYLPIPSPELDHVPAGSIKMGVYGLTSRFGKVEFARLPFAIPIAPVQGSPNRVRGLDGWPDDRLPRLVRYRVTLMETALELCRKGLAVAYLPRFVVALHNAQVRPAFALDELPGPHQNEKASLQTVYVVRRKADVDRREAGLVARAVRAYCRTR
jgi:DNA-binding transcriptional LysR family regulator